MKIHIDDSRVIADVQEEFNKVFPYLKIEFFKKPHGVGTVSAKEDMLPSETTLGKWRSEEAEGDFSISKDDTVAAVETGFQKKYGLSVQVFRKSNKVWLETSATDSWTLAEQNAQGAFMEEEVG